MLERLFKMKEAGTTVRIEILGGLTTFMTMAYIIFLNPAVLSKDFAGQPTGISFDAVMFATCLAAFIGTFIMGVYANYPIAQAPGMGENFFYVTVVMALAARGVTNAWQVALGIVFVAGVVFLLLSVFRFRKVIIDAVSPSMKNGIAVGIGLFIAFIGLQNAKVITANPGTLVQLNSNVKQAEVLIFFAGLLITAILLARRVRGAILLGIVLTALIALIDGQIKYTAIFGTPKDHAFFKADILGALNPEFIAFIVVFLFMDMFDTVGTIIGVSEQAGFIKNNVLPRADRALISDARATVAGACAGTSTVTSYIESAVGVQYGARTGLASVATAFFFLIALLFTPLVGMVGGYEPITAPALVIVGAMMVRNVFKIDWEDWSESVPAFLMMIGIPLTFTIHNGMAIGFIAYPIIKILSGKAKEASWLIYVVAILFILRYALIKM